MATNGSFPAQTITVRSLEDKGRFTLVETDSGTYSIWEDKYQFLGQLEVGATVTVYVKETHKDGRTYKNIMGAAGTESSPTPSVSPQPVPAAQLPMPAPVGPSRGAEAFRIAALHSAVILAAHKAITVPKIEETANEFVAYLEGKNTNTTQEDSFDDMVMP